MLPRGGIHGIAVAKIAFEHFGQRAVDFLVIQKDINLEVDGKTTVIKISRADGREVLIYDQGLCMQEPFLYLKNECQTLNLVQYRSP